MYHDTFPEFIQSSKKRGRSFFNNSVKSRLLSFSIPFDSLHRYHYRSLPCSRSWTLNLLAVVRETWFHQFLNDRFPHQLLNFQKWINITLSIHIFISNRIQIYLECTNILKYLKICNNELFEIDAQQFQNWAIEENFVFTYNRIFICRTEALPLKFNIYWLNILNVAKTSFEHK